MNSKPENEKEAQFQSLVDRVHRCQKCTRMNGSARVLGTGCGPLDAPLMFIGEAPGRLGADGSHLPFHGDKSGHNFESLIEHVGISRYEVFITNAVLCNPKDEKGNNATPTSEEISNCASFLQETIEIIDPAIVVTLGAIALKSCDFIERHNVALRKDVRTSQTWFSRALIPIYHPGQRAMIHRSFANQLSDYQFIAETLRRLRAPGKKKSRTISSTNSANLALLVKRALQSSPNGLTYFGLHKLCFLAEIASLEKTGCRLTNGYVVRQKNGPYFVDLHLSKIPKLVPGVLILSDRGKLQLRLAPQIEIVTGDESLLLGEQGEALINKVMEKYGQMTDEELKRVVYMSKYMRQLLRRERSTGVNLYNASILPYVPHNHK